MKIQEKTWWILGGGLLVAVASFFTGMKLGSKGGVKREADKNRKKHGKTTRGER